METEWEATFWPIDKDEVRGRLKAAGATRIYPERLMRRTVYDLPTEMSSTKIWARVRDEGDRITMSIKESGSKLEEQKETQLVVDNFEIADIFLTALGCKRKAYQETKRELWKLQGAELTIDEWPHLEPFLEIEGISEEHIRDVAAILGYDWSVARFCSVDTLYTEQYDIDYETINTGTPRLVFEGPNPFLKAGN